MVVPKVTWTDLLSWSWFSSCCRTRWLVATLSCVSLAELNESPSFLPCRCLMRVGPKRCCAAAGRSERQPYCSSHSEGHTHTMFLVQVHCHLLDGSLNGSAMILPFSAPTFYASWSVMCLAPWRGFSWIPAYQGQRQWELSQVQSVLVASVPFLVMSSSLYCSCPCYTCLPFLVGFKVQLQMCKWQTDRHCLVAPTIVQVTIAINPCNKSELVVLHLELNLTEIRCWWNHCSK